MTPDWKSTKLFKWLERRNGPLAARATAVREEQSKWLPYLLQIFPHYPGHGVEHSDRIVSQLSHLLFQEGKGKKGNEPAVAFSTAEVYCLICAAYLHDMGMVVSPAEQAHILESDAWKSFVSDGGKGHEGHTEYTSLRSRASTDSDDKKHFLADTALRYLIADFIRRDHHERGVATLQMHDFLKQLVDHGDSVAFETIAAVCVGHGLNDRELSDKDRFAEERLVFGEKVNVRFLTRLLRIGDLLDMDTSRTDPMSAKAIAPLPPSATPHWRQYGTKLHENISPELIEFRYECHDQETHRILRDWLGWLEAEVRATALDQMHARRHREWIAPRCVVESHASSTGTANAGQATITIKPARGAAYNFHDWRIEMDQEAVLQLLINRVYEDPLVFVRELIQNALDATRCRMYADFELQSPGGVLPERPTQFAAEFRERYPLRLSLKEESVPLTPDGPTEVRSVLTIEDHGVGMDERIITRYFLQVGRSYYKSTDFRQRFKFVPTSRFGIGFLSTFAVSDHIKVETAFRDSESGALKGTRLILREPRNYLLTETWKPFEERPPAMRTGTRIQVFMNSWPSGTKLVDIVRHWCVAVEIPVIVTESNETTEVRPEPWTDRMVLGPSGVDPKGRFIARVFNVDHGGIEGQVGVVAYEDDAGEGWCDCWPRDIGLDRNTIDICPSLGMGFHALHGVLIGQTPLRIHTYTDSPQWQARIDTRAATEDVQLSRRVLRAEDSRTRMYRRSQHAAHGLQASAVDAARQVTEQAVLEHLAHAARAKGPRGAYYIGKVLSLAPVSQALRESFPGTVISWHAGKRKDISVAELLSMEKIVLPAWRKPYVGGKRHVPDLFPKDVPCPTPVISYSDTPAFSHEALVAKLRNMDLVAVENTKDLWYLHYSSSGSNAYIERSHTDAFAWTMALDACDDASITCEFLRSDSSSLYILNQRHPVIGWLQKLREYALKDSSEISVAEVEACWLTAATAWYHMDDLLETWYRSSKVPAKYKPPRRKGQGLVGYSNSKLHSSATVFDTKKH